MENHITRRISRLFPSSISSCRFMNVSDVIEQSMVASKTPRNVFPADQIPSPYINGGRPRKSSSMAKPRKRESTKVVPDPRNMSSELGTDTGGRRCPPVTQISPLNPHQKSGAKQCSVTVKTSSSSTTGGLFSSEDDDDEAVDDGFAAGNEAFLSLSSDSSDSSGRKIPKTSRRRSGNGDLKMGQNLFHGISSSTTDSTSTGPPRHHRKTTAGQTSQIAGGACRRAGTRDSRFAAKTEAKQRIETEASVQSDPGDTSSQRGRQTRQWPVVVGGKVEESYAVAKTSSDPYRDFRESMVEMIVEKKIRGAEDLERLLQCFLALNSSHHHKVILDAFSDICEALFSVS